MCWGALLCHAESVTKCVKPYAIFEGSHAENQWPP